MKPQQPQYKRLTNEERVQISRWAWEGVSKREIARRLSRSAQTIRAELARCPTGNYCPIQASHQAEQRRHQWKARKLQSDEQLRELVIGLLQRRWTPERISGWLKAQGGAQQVSAKTIYTFVRTQRGQRLGLPRLLPRHYKRRRGKDGRSGQRIRIPGRTPISARPEAANKRLEAGHWEADLVCGRPGTRAAILTLNERVTRYYEAHLIPDSKAETVIAALKSALSAYPRHARRSVTFDNGGEFVRHEELHSLGVETYFADPCAPHQRGANENSNGLLRRFVKKGTDLRTVTADELEGYVELINEWPKKCLGFLPPADEFGKLIKRPKAGG